MEHFQVRAQNIQFAFKDCEMQVVLDNRSNIVEIEDNIPEMVFTFNDINGVNSLEKDAECGNIMLVGILNITYFKISRLSGSAL